MSSAFEIDMAFRRKLLIKRKIYPAFFYHNGKWWIRCSAQIWSQVSRLSTFTYPSPSHCRSSFQVEDFEVLGQAILEASKEILEEFGDGTEKKTMSIEDKVEKVN